MDTFRGAVMDLRGGIIHHRSVPIGVAGGEQAVALAAELARELVALAERPLLGVGVASPGVVSPQGVVLRAPALGWRDVSLQDELTEALGGIPTRIVNDANAAALAEHSFGNVEGDLIVVRIGHGVAAGLVLGDTLMLGNHFSAGEIGHVMIGTDGGRPCACGRIGCLETWLSIPHIQAELRSPHAISPAHVLREAGRRLGIALAPVVGSLNLSQVVLTGIRGTIGDQVVESTRQTLARRINPDYQALPLVRLSELGEDNVLKGAAVMVISAQLGVS